MTIWKFPIEIKDKQIVPMPKGAKIIKAGLDPTGHPCIWAVVDVNKKPVNREIYVYGTGQEIQRENHIGSFIDGSFVWHVFQ